MSKKQNILVIGASGALGSAIVKALNSRGHEVIEASHSKAEYSVDTTNSDSITTLFEEAAKKYEQLDAVVVAAGSAPFGDLQNSSYDDMYAAINGKGLSQLDVVRIGQKYVKETGSFTLITGILTDVPLQNSSFAAAANGMVKAFVNTAAANISQRINVVSPNVLTESMSKYADTFTGFIPVDAAEAAQYYVRSVEGIETGKCFNVGY
ncbi:MAG: short chain dehydrogenase [Micrococcaceae bacterium]